MIDPPQDIGAERSVLGSMLIRSEVIPDVCDVLAAADYYRPIHESIHEAIVSLHDRRRPVDMVTVAQELTQRGELERVGGPAYLAGLVADVHVPATAPTHALIVVDRALARRMVEAGQRIIQLGESGADMTEAAEDARQIVDAATSHARTAEAGLSAGDALDAAIDWLETEPTGAATPWADVNDRTNGLLDGSLVTIGARPGHGKSLAAKDIGLYTARQGKPVHIATLEMSRNEYLARILCSLGNINLSNMLRRQMSEGEWGTVSTLTSKVRELPLYLDDRPGQSMAQIRAAARQTARRYGDLRLVAIDYAQLVTPANDRLPRQEQVSGISRTAKLMAKELSCPVLLLAQLNRGNQQRSDHRPMLSDLRESGALEQDSDQVWFLHRPDQYEAESPRMGEVDLIVGKNRNGPAPVTIPLAFQGHYARIVSMV